MKQLLLIFTILLGIASTSWSQEENKNRDSLQVTRSFGEFLFYHNGVKIKKRDYIPIICKDPKAKKLFIQANNQGALASVFSIAGSFGVGWTIGSFLASNSPDQVNWKIGAIGLGAILISLPIASSAENLHKAAAKKFNEGTTNNLSFLERGELNLQISPNRIGVQFNF